MMCNRDKNFMWDSFVEYCWSNNLSTDDIDFHAWCDHIVDEAIDDAIWDY